MRSPAVLCCLLVALASTGKGSEKDTHVAYSMHLSNNWKIDGDLPTNALLISLQGIVNGSGPRFYLVYTPEYPYNYTGHLYEYYREKKGFSFTELATPEDALSRFASDVSGYVVWDTSCATSLRVAFTAAGLMKAVVVSEDQVPLVERHGLHMKEDFRGRFNGMTDYEIYHVAYDLYWKECDHDFIVWMGGVGGRAMQPGIADFGMYHRAFFTDLSCDPKDTLEYRFADSLMAQKKKYSWVLGWHSYAKDTEGQYITLISRNVQRQEGLNTWPNMSFNSQIPLTPGYKFKNHSFTQNVKSPGRKVYISLVQTDGLGLGAWMRPGRGKIPYTWEVADGNSYELAPGLLEYFYENRTPKDYFIGALSGPSYMYPKPIPKKDLPEVIARARKQMELLDLHIMGIMDYSEGNRYYGNIDLPRYVVDAYYEGMPDALGFINGYGPANTIDFRNGRPFLSYNFYLSPDRPVADAAADLEELAALNPARPYYLVVHVRESSDMTRVKDIIDRLGPEFEVVPLDVLMKYAGAHPTFGHRYRGE